jgi:cyclase
MQVTQSIFLETGYPGANVSYITTQAGVVMIEAPLRPSDAVKWRQQVQSKGQIIYLINTEPHDDHIAGDYFFNVPVVAHEKARELVQTIDVKHILGLFAAMDPGSEALVREYKLRLPSITYSSTLNLYCGNHTFKLIYTPGHSHGQTAVFIPEERAVFTGDNVTYQIHGYLHEADPFAWLESLKLIGGLDVDRIIPGHGAVCNKRYLKEQTTFVEGAIQVIRDARKKGWSVEEARSRIKKFPSPYPFDAGPDEIKELYMGLSVENLYRQIPK